MSTPVHHQHLTAPPPLETAKIFVEALQQHAGADAGSPLTTPGPTSARHGGPGASSSHLPPSNKPRLFNIVLTGGPCAGKTTANVRLANYLRMRGVVVYTVPEVPTLLFTNGAARGGQAELQEVILGLQKSLEESFMRLADHYPNRPVVLLCDRGLLDPRAYATPAEFERALAPTGLSLAHVLDGRYDAVLHLETAAKNAEAFYTTANNAARVETPDEARALDDRVLAAWVGHPALVVIGNHGTFEDKMRAVEAAVAAAVGLPAQPPHMRHYLLAGAPEFPPHVAPVTFEVEKVYLKTDPWARLRTWVHDRHRLLHEQCADNHGDAAAGHQPAEPHRLARPRLAARRDSLLAPAAFPYAFVRSRRQNGLTTYHYTYGDLAGDGQVIEESRRIDFEQFESLKHTQRDHARPIVTQTRHSFVHKGQYMEIKVNHSPSAGLAILYCAGCTPVGPCPSIEFPPWLHIAHEITNDETFNTYNLGNAAPTGPAAEPLD